MHSARAGCLGCYHAFTYEYLDKKLNAKHDNTLGECVGDIACLRLLNWARGITQAPRFCKIRLFSVTPVLFQVYLIDEQQVYSTVGSLELLGLCLPVDSPSVLRPDTIMAFNWRKYDAWRQHPMLTNNMRHSIPGLGIGLAAFAVYVLYDNTLGRGKKVHH